jgi:hypothetical protein
MMGALLMLWGLFYVLSFLLYTRWWAVWAVLVVYVAGFFFIFRLDRIVIAKPVNPAPAGGVSDALPKDA